MSEVSIGSIYNRVCKWNAQRYDRVFNKELTFKLLDEEIKEHFDASSKVEQLDALCDIIYVALGALWKLDVDNMTLDYNAEEAANQVLKLVETNTIEPIYLAYAILLKYANDNDYPATLAMQVIVTLCMTQLHYMGLTTEESVAAVLVVCDSNDSKSIKKTASDVKANAGDKGAFFVPPEPRLQLILNKVEARHGC